MNKIFKFFLTTLFFLIVFSTATYCTISFTHVYGDVFLSSDGIEYFPAEEEKEITDIRFIKTQERSGAAFNFSNVSSYILDQIL